MNRKRIHAAHTNIILILIIIFFMIIFVISNYNEYNKSETVLNQLGNYTLFSDEQIADGSWQDIVEDLYNIGIDIGYFGLDVLRVLFVWIPLVHAVFLLLFSGISWMIFKPTDNRIIAYRVLMTFAYLNIITTVIVSIVGMNITQSKFSKFKIFVFILYCLVALIINFIMTYTYRIRFYNYNKSNTYDKANQVPVVRSSICTGEKVAGFKDLQSGKFQEVMLVTKDKDMQKFLKYYGINIEDVKKEW